MKFPSKLCILLLIAALGLGATFCACSPSTDSTSSSATDSTWSWSADSAWYQSSDSVSPDKIDLLYIVSTDVVSDTDESGKPVYRARLTADDRKALDAEFAYVEKNISQHDFNYFAPYYHQFTFDAISLPEKQFNSEYRKVAKEVCEAFDYYMQHKNQGREFALVGFSQGGMLVLDLLKHMNSEQYRKMVAAYVLGYRLSADDLKCGRILPATDEDTPGVTISFNSVLSTDGIWPFVGGGAVTCINPVNWKTDATPATFEYNGCAHTVHVDTATWHLIVETDPTQADEYRKWTDNPVFQSADVSTNCLHHWDLLFYPQFIHDNILKRANRQ